MSARIDEYHGDEAKALTTDEVERWREFLGDSIQLRRTLATTRALETAQVALVMRSQRTVEEIERSEKAERERDEARATVAELVEVMAMALGWAECDAKSLAAIEARNRWPDHLPTGFETRVARLRSALAKAKGAANG